MRIYIADFNYEHNWLEQTLSGYAWFKVEYDENGLPYLNLGIEEIYILLDQDFGCIFVNNGRMYWKASHE